MKKKLYRLLQNREFIFISIVAITPLLVKNKILSLYNNKDNSKYLLEYPTTSLSLDIVLGFVLVLLTFQLFYKLKNGIIANTTRVFLLIVITIWYSVVRFILGWQFSPTHIIDKLYYVDLIIIITYYSCILIIKNVFVNYAHRTLDRSENDFEIRTNQEGFILESLEKNKAHDILGRKNYAKTIANTIIKSKIGRQESCAIGITGSWGSGKSFFLNEIKNSLNQNECIIIDFNPWKNHASKNLINNFFDTFNDALSEYNPMLSSQIRQYANQLAEAEDNSYTKIVDFLFQLLYGKKSIDELYKEINATINEINKKIIVFVDDLDRLDGSEVLEIVKLIRASSNFENTVFVVAYDKEYILNILNSQLSIIKNNFLEKIFIAEFCLPDFENEILSKELERRLIDSNDTRYHALIREYFNTQDHYLSNILSKCIISIRDVIRFPNVFKVNFNHINNQVWFYDFLNLELIRYRFPTIHNFIKINLKHLQENDKMFLFTLDEKKTSYLWNNDETVKHLDINILFTLFKQHKYKNKDDSHPVKILIDSSLNENTSLGIRCYSNSQTYFTLRLIEKALDETEFQRYKSDDTTQFLDKVEEWCQLSDFTFESFSAKIHSVTRLDTSIEYKNILRSLYFLVEKSFNIGAQYTDNINLSCFCNHTVEYTKTEIFKLDDFKVFFVPQNRYSPFVTLELINHMFLAKSFDKTSVFLGYLEEIFLKSLKDAFHLTKLKTYLDYYPFKKTLSFIKDNAVFKEHTKGFVNKMLKLQQGFVTKNRELFLNIILGYKEDGKFESLDVEILYQVFLDDEKIKLFFNAFGTPLDKELWDIYHLHEDNSDILSEAEFSENALKQLQELSRFRNDILN